VPIAAHERCPRRCLPLTVGCAEPKRRDTSHNCACEVCTVLTRSALRRDPQLKRGLSPRSRGDHKQICADSELSRACHATRGSSRGRRRPDATDRTSSATRRALSLSGEADNQDTTPDIGTQVNRTTPNARIARAKAPSFQATSAQLGTYKPRRSIARPGLGIARGVSNQCCCLSHDSSACFIIYVHYVAS
jgi:hypothetical protein